jgi:hypothetical protein
MLVAILFALTALVTGLHNVYLLMDVVNGAPINLLNCIALFGSVVLLIAAVLAPARLRVAAMTGLAGTLLLWAFYSTVIVIWFSMPFSTWQEIHGFISFREYVPVTGMLLGPILLAVCTVTELWTIKARA